VIDGILGIDVSKDTLDVSISSCTKVRTKSFANSSEPRPGRRLAVQGGREDLPDAEYSPDEPLK
jgi:hypothetical protein